MFSDLDAGAKTLKALKKQIRQYRQSVLKSAFEGKLTAEWRKANKGKSNSELFLDEVRNDCKEKKTKKYRITEVNTGYELDCPLEWSTPRLHEISISITDGDHQAPPKASKGIPFLVISNISKGRLDFAKTRYVPDKYYDELDEYRKPRSGDIIYSVTGSFGIPLIVDTDREFCFQRHIALIRSSKLLSLKYQYFFLKSNIAYTQAKYVATGTAQLTVPLNGLRNFVIPFPSLEEQEQIISEIERHFSIADKVEEVVETALKQSGRLRQSILKRAFEGKLVPQDPNDEPAEKLLQRIGKEKIE